MSKDDEIQEFDWAKEFPQVCDENGNFEGFDVVIGNPPYMYNRDIRLREREFYKAKYQTADDLYAYFLYEGINLLKTDGYFSFITPNTYFSLIIKENFRRTLLNYTSQKFTYSGFCFKEAYVETQIFAFQKRLNGNNLIEFVEKPNDYKKYETVKAPKDFFINNYALRLFYPTPINLYLYENVIKPSQNLLNEYAKLTKRSKNLDSLRSKYLKNLQEGDITLLGLICKGGVGIVTGNNSRYVASIVNNKEDIRNIASKFLETYNKISGEKASIEDFIKKPNYFYEKAELLKQRLKQPSVFGKFFKYKFVTQNQVKHFNDLTAHEKKYGTKEKTWIYYNRGNTDGHKWYVPYNEAIEWSKKSVTELKDGVVTNSRWHGIPFFYATGFAWIDYFTDKLKAFFVEEGVYAKNTVKMHSETDLISDKVMTCLLNSKLLTYIIKQFITSTHTLQINDGRLIPIKIPRKSIHQKLEELFDKIFEIRTNDLNAAILPYENQIDKMVYKLYGLTKQEIAEIERFYE